MWQDIRMADPPSDRTVPDKTGFPPDGYALADAPRAVTDPLLWEDFERASDAARGLFGTYALFSINGEPIAGWAALGEAKRKNALIAEKDRTQTRVKKSFMAQLRAGDLIAMGLLTPLRPDTVPVQIPVDHWWVLVPIYQNSTAKGAGAEYVRIQIYRRQDLEQRAVDSPSSEEQGPDPGPVVPNRRHFGQRVPGDHAPPLNRSVLTPCRTPGYPIRGMRAGSGERTAGSCSAEIPGGDS